RAVAAAWAAGGRADDAWILGIDRSGNLRHQSHVLRAGTVVGVGDVLGARDLAVGGGHVAIDVDVRPVERAVTSVRIDIDQGAVVVVDRKPPQLGRRWIRRIGDRGRDALQAGLAQARRQKVVGDAVVGCLADRAGDEGRLEVRCRIAAACHRAGRDQYCRAGYARARDAFADWHDGFLHELWARS